MPKLKTNSGSKKRFRRTANGFKHRSQGRNHINTKMTSKRKRQLRSQRQVNASDLKGVMRLMGKVKRFVAKKMSKQGGEANG